MHAMLMYACFALGLLVGAPITAAFQAPPSKAGVVFFSGGNARMPKFLYKDFMRQLENQNVTVHDASMCSTDTELDAMVQGALEAHETVGLLSHSLGSKRLVETANFYPQVKNIIMLDPVRSLEKDTHFKHHNTCLMVRATRAHEFWSSENGLKVPFLLGFHLRPRDVALKQGGAGVRVVDATNYGHVDVCDSELSDFMHATRLSEGVEDRAQLPAYRAWMASLIRAYLANEPLQLPGEEAQEAVNDEDNFMPPSDTAF